MAVIFHKKPELKEPVMFCGWPGIGNIGILAIDTLKNLLKAQEFAELEAWDFFEPQKVLIEGGILKDLEFPSNKFYFKRIEGQDVIFFIGQQQPAEGRTKYSQGQKAYDMANLVLDVAERFDCQRVFTSGAAVTKIHHTYKPRVWAVPNNQKLIGQIKQYQNVILMSEIEGKGEEGLITGLNGLLLGVAKKRGLNAICLMGEIPYYLQAAPWPYPKASKSVLEVVAKMLDVRLNFSTLDELAQRVEQSIDEFLDSLYSAEAIPPDVRDEIEKLRHVVPTRPGPITDDEQKKIMEHIDELFDQGGRKDERHL